MHNQWSYLFFIVLELPTYKNHKNLQNSSSCDRSLKFILKKKISIKNKVVLILYKIYYIFLINKEKIYSTYTYKYVYETILQYVIITNYL